MQERPSLRPFIRPGLDVLFVALNPPTGSNANGHWFSGEKSQFFKLLFLSGLITGAVEKSKADEIVFGTNNLNYRRANFGVTDLVEDQVETDSGRVRFTQDHVSVLISRIRENCPRFACVIHYKVRDALNLHGNLISRLEVGCCGRAIPGCTTDFIVNYFPNGNSKSDDEKIAIFKTLRDKI